MKDKITKESNITIIDLLIGDIPKEQIKILKLIWDYFVSHKEWPNGKRFRKEQGRLNIENLVTHLAPIFVLHFKNNPKEDYYGLTTEGVYAIEGLEGPDIRLLLSYLDYLKEKFDQNPEFEKVMANEVKEVLHIGSEEIRILGELLYMGNSYLWGHSSSNLCSSDWETGPMHDIEILFELNNSEEFLFKQWYDNIKLITRYRPEEIPNILTTKIAQFDTKAEDNSKYIQELREIISKSTNSKNSKKIFIGHGKSPVWRELKDFISDRLHLECDEFNREATAGLSIKERLLQMLNEAGCAFLILTAEDEHADGSIHARENVIHEVGLFQGRLGFEKAIILLEEGCEEFSNIYGISQIRFKESISYCFEKIRLTLEREHFLS